MYQDKTASKISHHDNEGNIIMQSGKAILGVTASWLYMTKQRKNSTIPWRKQKKYQANISERNESQRNKQRNQIR